MEDCDSCSGLGNQGFGFRISGLGFRINSFGRSEKGPTKTLNPFSPQVSCLRLWPRHRRPLANRGNSVMNFRAFWGLGIDREGRLGSGSRVRV